MSAARGKPKGGPEAPRAPIPDLRLPPLHETRTASGLSVLVAPRGPLPLVTLRLTMAAGSAADPPGKEGLAELTSQLCRRGTARMSADEINEAVEFVGASLFTGTSEDTVTFGITTPSEHALAMLDVLAQVATEPSFPALEVESGRARALAQLANDLDDPALLADRAVLRALWGNHPYGHDVAGMAHSVSTFTREDMLRFHGERLGPRVGHLVVVGAVDPAAIAEAADRAFSRWSGGPDAPPALPVPERAALAGKVVVVDKPDQTQSQVRLGSLTFRWSHPDYIASQVANAVLGGGFTSRLVDEIRVNRGLSYGASSFIDPSRVSGSFQISTFTKTETTEEIVAVALAEVEKMRRRGPRPPEMEKARAYLCGLYPMRLETNESLAGAIADVRVNGLGDDYLQRYRGRVVEVSREKAAELAARWFLPEEGRAVVVVGRAEQVIPQMEALGTVEVWKVADLG